MEDVTSQSINESQSAPPIKEEIKNYLHGQSLLNAINTVSVVREPLIEGLLYKKSAQMIFAPDGVGKSVISLQMAMQATIDDGKVFGEFHVPKGVRTLYLQTERSIDENLERLKFMQMKTKWNADNLIIDTSLQGLNIQQEKHFTTALINISESISFTTGGVDLIVIDPIYPLVGGDLTSNEDVSPITNLSRMLQNLYHCSILLIHHTNRGSYDKEEKKRVGRDMFGSAFLSAHCTGVYALNVNEDESGSMLECKKSSQKNLEKKVNLVFDPESFLSYYSDSQKLSKKERANHFIMQCKASKKTFTYDDLEKVTSFCPSKLRGYLKEIEEVIEICGKSNHGRLIYKVREK